LRGRREAPFTLLAAVLFLDKTLRDQPSQQHPARRSQELFSKRKPYG